MKLVMTAIQIHRTDVQLIVVLSKQPIYAQVDLPQMLIHAQPVHQEWNLTQLKTLVFLYVVIA